MSNGRTELFAFLGAAFATLIGLFVANRLYASYIDVQYHARLAAGAPYEAVASAREQEQTQLAGGKIPLDTAMQLLAQRGRGNFGSIAAAPSDDLSALSGWIRHPNFKPVVAHPIRTPRAPEVVAPPPVVVEAPPAAPAAAQPKRRPTR
jgi:hypothetical protein